jgi:hypothetical protein
MLEFWLELNFGLHFSLSFGLSFFPVQEKALILVVSTYIHDVHLAITASLPEF